MYDPIDILFKDVHLNDPVSHKRNCNHLESLRVGDSNIVNTSVGFSLIIPVSNNGETRTEVRRT